MAAFSYTIASININTISNQTKLNALHNFIRLLDLDIILLQEVEDKQMEIPGYNTITNVDHSKRGTAVAVKQHISISHVDRSLDGRLIVLRLNNSVTLCNIYAPSGVQQKAQREYFFNTTFSYYLRDATEHIVLGGDFNSVVDARDSTGNSNYSASLRYTLQQLQLADVWETLRRSQTGYTYVTHNSASRIDRIYVSTNLRSQLRETNTHVCSFTNHKALTLRLCLPYMGAEYGRGFWAIRPQILSAENIAEFELKWNYWLRQRRQYTSWMDWWTAYTKGKILSFFRWKSRELFNNFNREHQQLYTQLRMAYDQYFGNPMVLSTINRIKSQMLLLQRRFSDTFMQINETRIAGEPLSAFQLGEKRRKRTIINQLATDNEGELTETRQIEQHVFNYFQQLYAETETGNADEFMLERAIPEDSISNRRCMDEITTDEIFQAIKTSSFKKSPGCDGIPVEFYSRTFDIIHRQLNLIMNEALQGNFTDKFVTGVIVLVKKKGPDKSIKSYRPISLLNSDYKLLSRIIKTRLDRTIAENDILSPAQKCSNGKHNIFQATLSIKDRIASLKENRRRGKLISFDFDHAFDRVDRRFLFRTMESLGFNTDLIALINKIGQLSTSRVLVNGNLSPSFPIQRSVRQGDPIAMHLFVLYIHPLIRNLEGICNGPDDLVTAYADDITVITTTTDKIESVKVAFERFETLAGAKLNYNKTYSLDIGFINNDNRLAVPWLQTADTVKVLGINFANSVRLMSKINWDHLVNIFAQQLWMHRCRTLSLHQKVVLLNTWITSKIWYVSSVVAINNIHVAKLTSLMGTFLWSGQSIRVPMLQLALPVELGGLKLQLPGQKCKALLISRHLSEIEFMPFYRNFLNQAQIPPNLQMIPANCPCLKTIVLELPYLSLATRTNLTSHGVHMEFVMKTEPAKIMRENPTLDWKRIWRNIADRRLNNTERGLYYLLVNNKMSHQALLYRMQRVDSPNCVMCNVPEDLMHKLSTCRRVSMAWTVLQTKLRNIASNRNFSFDSLRNPELKGINRRDKIQVLRAFIQYIVFITLDDNQIDIDALSFHLDSEI